MDAEELARTCDTIEKAKSLIKNARTRGNETEFTRLEEARPHALEVAQEADAPPHARPEDAQAVASAHSGRSRNLTPRSARTRCLPETPRGRLGERYEDDSHP